MLCTTALVITAIKQVGGICSSCDMAGGCPTIPRGVRDCRGHAPDAWLQD